MPGMRLIRADAAREHQRLCSTPQRACHGLVPALDEFFGAAVPAESRRPLARRVQLLGLQRNRSTHSIDALSGILGAELLAAAVAERLTVLIESR